MSVIVRLVLVAEEGSIRLAQHMKQWWCSPSVVRRFDAKDELVIVVAPCHECSSIKHCRQVCHASIKYQKWVAYHLINLSPICSIFA